MVRIVLIRPGSTDFDEQGRITGTLDIPLNEPQNNSGISRPITTGKPVMELFG